MARKLRERGDDVRVFGRRVYTELEAIGIDCVRGDIADYDAVRAACEDREVIFHTAAKVGLWGSFDEYCAVNAGGTKNVLRACSQLGISKLVYTSSPSVVFNGEDIAGVDERAPYPAGFDSHYSRSKAQAEQMVLAADHDHLSTIALRPHLIWGPGDRHLMPRVIDRAKSGRLFRIGSENKLVDTLYIDDAVQAHILAAIQLSPLSDISGKAFFLSAGDPRPLWEIVGRMLAAAGLPPVTKRISKPLAVSAAWACEAFWRMLGASSEPPLTRFLVSQLTTAHWFDVSAAKRELGWQPRVRMEDGMERVAQWIRAVKPYD